MPCTKLKEMLKDEMGDLEMELDKHKYYLSQRFGFDVGKEFAEKDYLQNHLNAWASGWKDCYCKHVCIEECQYRSKNLK